MSLGTCCNPELGRARHDGLEWKFTQGLALGLRLMCVEPVGQRQEGRVISLDARIGWVTPGSLKSG